MACHPMYRNKCSHSCSHRCQCHSRKYRPHRSVSPCLYLLCPLPEQLWSNPAIRPPSNRENNFFFALIPEFLLTLLVSFTRRQRTGRIPFPPSIRVFMWKYCSSFLFCSSLCFFTSVVLYFCYSLPLRNFQFPSG